MAKYGARNITIAKFDGTTVENSSTAPAYADVLTVGGEIVKCSDDPQFTEMELWAGDKIAESENEFVKAGLTVEVSGFTPETKAAIFGASTPSVGSDSGTYFSDRDSAPYCGFGFISVVQRGGTKYYKTVFYPKVKFRLGADEYSTKSASSGFETEKLSGNAYQPLSITSNWKEENEYTSESAAVTALAAKFT